MAEAGRRPRPGNSGTSPGPCIRMDTAAPSRQQLERNQYAASPQGGEPQRPGKWGFGGFQPLQAQKSRWKVTGTMPAGVPSDTQHPPPKMAPEEKRDESWGVSLPGALVSFLPHHGSLRRLLRGDQASAVQEALWEGCLAHSPQRASTGMTSSESKHTVPEGQPGASPSRACGSRGPGRSAHPCPGVAVADLQFGLCGLLDHIPQSFTNTLEGSLA